MTTPNTTEAAPLVLLAAPAGVALLPEDAAVAATLLDVVLAGAEAVALVCPLPTPPPSPAAPAAPDGAEAVVDGAATVERLASAAADTGVAGTVVELAALDNAGLGSAASAIIWAAGTTRAPPPALNTAAITTANAAISAPTETAAMVVVRRAGRDMWKFFGSSGVKT